MTPPPMVTLLPVSRNKNLSDGDNASGSATRTRMACDSPGAIVDAPITLTDAD